VDKLVQHYLFIPAKYKEVYLVFLCNEFSGNSMMVFVDTQSSAQKLAFVLKNLGFSAVCIHGGMPQPKRLSALNKFRSGDKNILVATDVASRGLDIPTVDVVVNFDIPASAKDYVHRVGRTARAGRAGRAVSIVSQYDVENYQRVEALIAKKLDAFPCEEAQVLLLLERVHEASRIATMQMHDVSSRAGGKRRLSSVKNGIADAEGGDDFDAPDDADIDPEQEQVHRAERRNRSSSKPHHKKRR